MDLLLLSTHDTGYERPDGPTIAKVLGSLDGGRNVQATLGASDSTYLQATAASRAASASTCRRAPWNGAIAPATGRCHCRG